MCQLSSILQMNRTDPSSYCLISDSSLCVWLMPVGTFLTCEFYYDSKKTMLCPEPEVIYPVTPKTKTSYAASLGTSVKAESLKVSTNHCCYKSSDQRRMPGYCVSTRAQLRPEQSCDILQLPVQSQLYCLPFTALEQEPTNIGLSLIYIYTHSRQKSLNAVSVFVSVKTRVTSLSES